MQRQLRYEAPSHSRTAARMWPDFVNIEKRMGKEVPFIAKQVKEGRKPLVFDACLGCGATTIGLRLRNVADVVSNEIDPEMRDVAVAEGRRRDVRIKPVSYDWRDMPEHLDGTFDMVACLGNSITLLFDRNERLLALRNFASVLVPGGKLAIDERNYPRILEGRFSQSGEYVYCGTDKVVCTPVHVSEELVVMRYTHLQSGDTVEYRLYPFKSGELPALLHEAGFGRVRVFGDYKDVYLPKDAEFFTYVAEK